MTGSSEPAEHVDLFGFVRGELSTDEALEVGEHLRDCATCRDDLLETAVGNAVLARAGRTEVVRAPIREASGLPPLEVPRRRRTTRPGGVLLVAAAVALAVAVGGIAALRFSGDEPPAPAPQVATLDPLDGAESGEVRIAAGTDDTEVTILTQDLPDVGAGAFYQAWLLDPSTEKMLALGPLSGATSRFRVDSDLLAAYSAVDISLETDDGDPGHSATSVLRGSY